jgi:hypothetical protein
MNQDIVQCPYNTCHMSLAGRLPRHMWKCHKNEYTRDLDAQLQQRLHTQQEEMEESWDNDNNYPTYVPTIKPWWKKTQLEEEESWDDDDNPTYVPPVTPKWKNFNKQQQTPNKRVV